MLLKLKIMDTLVGRWEVTEEGHPHPINVPFLVLYACAHLVIIHRFILGTCEVSCYVYYTQEKVF